MLRLRWEYVHLKRDHWITYNTEQECLQGASLKEIHGKQKYA